MSSPFVVFDTKGGEVIHKDSKIGRANKWNNKVRGSIKIWSTQVGGQAHKLVCCIWMCIIYVCLHGTSFKFHIHACMVYARFVENDWWNEN